MRIFTLDGQSYDVLVPVDGGLTREAVVADGPLAGRTKAHSMQRDLAGTFYNYTLKFSALRRNVGQYDALYEELTAPVAFHRLVVPYAQGMMEYEAYISKVPDTLKSCFRGVREWGDASVTFTAMEPQRVPGEDQPRVPLIGSPDAGNKLFRIDGLGYDVIVKKDGGVNREADIADGPLAKRSMAYRMRRDLAGTFYNYTMAFDTTYLNVAQYDALYEILTAPVDNHQIMVPYGQGFLEYQAYISKVTDSLKSCIHGVQRWGDLTVTFTAVSPHRRPQ